MGWGRRQFLRTTLAGTASFAGSALSRPADSRESHPPNILFLLADDMRWDAMGCMGHPQVRTPNLDELAGEGALFENAFVTTSICAPNRACILAGQHQRTTGIKDFATPFTEQALDRTYPVLLRRMGYRTGFIGKWGVGALSEQMLELPASRFDYWRGFVDQGTYFHEVDDQRIHLTTGLIPRQVDEFLDGCREGQPFCLSISFKAPHGPWRDFDPALSDLYSGADLPELPVTFTKEHFEALPPFLRDSLNGLNRKAHDDRWGRRLDPGFPAEQVAQYYRLITGLDVAVGKIRAALRARGLERDTVIIFASDNGHFLYEQGLIGKWLMYEPSIRVPFLVADPRLPGALRGRRLGEAVLTIDVAPTVLSLAGAEVPAWMQGRDLSPLLRGERVSWREDWFYEHTFTLAPPRTIAKSQGVRTARWKYVRYLDTNPHYEQLFDLRNDPQELTNLAGVARCQDVMERLRARYQHYRKALPDARPEPMEYGHYRTVTLSSEAADVAHDLGQGRTLGQTFVAEGERISGLRFRTPTWGKVRVPAGLTVELLEDGPGGAVIVQARVPAEAIANNAWCEAAVSCEVRPGSTLYLRIKPEHRLPERTIGVWGYGENLYADGTGHESDVPRAFDLDLRITYEDPEGYVPPRRDSARTPRRTIYRVSPGKELRGGQAPVIAGVPFRVSATIDPRSADGVIVAQGGTANGFSLYMANGRLAAATRHAGNLTLVSSPGPRLSGTVRVGMQLAADGTLSLEVDGKRVASGKAPGPIPTQPGDGLEAGADHHTPVGEYESPCAFGGRIRDATVRLGPW